MKALVVALHDVTPGTVDAVRRWRELVARRADGPVSLLVVPRYAGTDAWPASPGLPWIHWRASAGDEVVLHGHTHTTRVGADGPELGGVPRAEAARVLREGREELRQSGLRPEGVVFPAYAAPRAPAAAVEDAGLAWWASRTSLRAPGVRITLPSIGLGASTLPRRLLSPTAVRRAVPALAAVGAVRLDLHPADLEHDRLAAAAIEALHLLVAQGRELLTHAELLARVRVPDGAAPPTAPVTA